MGKLDERRKQRQHQRALEEESDAIGIATGPHQECVLPAGAGADDIHRPYTP
jgi:hypothetical protein